MFWVDAGRYFLAPVRIQLDERIIVCLREEAVQLHCELVEAMYCTGENNEKEKCLREGFTVSKMKRGVFLIDIKIRGVQPADLESVTNIEAACFPASEAASCQAFQERIAAFPESFLVAETEGHLIGFINGCVTDSLVICDEFFQSTSHHIASGENLTVFGLDVIPEYRNRGIAAKLMQQFIQLAQDSGRKRVILTCKAKLVHYYESFGYTNSGISRSTHGGAEWFDMTLTLSPEHYKN